MYSSGGPDLSLFFHLAIIGLIATGVAIVAATGGLIYLAVNHIQIVW